MDIQTQQKNFTSEEFKDILKSQGTRLSEIPPWMSYAASIDEKVSPDLEEAVKHYSELRHAKSSSQNEEELARQKEINNDIAKQYQWLHPSEYANEGERIGRIMHSSTFIVKLRNECGVKCWYRDHPQPKKVTMIVQRKPGMDVEVACWAQLGYMPEFSIVRFDDHGAPLDERLRGWRTCLLQLILKEIVTEEMAHKVFGKPEGAVAKRYLQTLYGVRNSYVKVKEEINVR